MSDPSAPRVSLFVTCLADLMRPSVAFASLRLLEQAGCIVDVPQRQTCCGQPGYNAGEYESAAVLARQFIEQFEAAEYVVAPSGSCAGMVREHYPRILQGEWRRRALALAQRTWELTSFLTEVVKLDRAPAVVTELPAITYHDSCAGLRELGIKQQPRELLRKLCQVDVKEMQQTEVCCGFGGTFCAKMPEISAKMTDDKLRNATATGAAMLTGGDLGCLLSIAGRARREGIDIEVRHVAEILAGDLYSPAIGEGE
ncbi:(Fe-S)-binding protein [Seongchinamella sediminis]|uniref:(Fe-S)-binding protein n=1 Tax=Seongchinamella sediminis TaxID=2283635 RepID=A0A3L7DYI5_9GAMM|nr:(Fe-S)-binding protein [Seongchinamella sediminis]RLQ22668.1 (Fe-S)-binding protein [Seongchinamella sediminis]